MLFGARYEWVLLTRLPPGKPQAPEAGPLGCGNTSQTTTAL